MLTATGTTSAGFQAWSGCPNPAGNQCIVIPTSTVVVGVQFGSLTLPPAIPGTRAIRITLRSGGGTRTLEWRVFMPRF